MAKKFGRGIGISTHADGQSIMFLNMAMAGSSALGSSHFAQPAKEIRSTVPEDILKIQPWSPWGADNLLPLRMLYDVETTGIVRGIVESKARFGQGQGIQPVIVHVNETTGAREIEKYVNDSEINDFNEANDSFYQSFAWTKDQVCFDWGAGSLMMNKRGDKVAQLQRDDLTEIRYEKKDPATGRSSHLYYSADWDKVKSRNDTRVFKRALLSHFNTIDDLEEKVKAGIIDHAFTFRNPGWGKHYYPTPLWMAAYKWVKIAQGVPEMKAALYNNTMRVKKMVVIHEEYWDNRFGNQWMDWDEDRQEEEEQKVFDEINDWLVGAKNANKPVFVKGYRNEKGETITDIEFIDIPDETKPGELLPDSAAANAEIAFAMDYNNAINGGNQKGGLYQQESGGSNVRESGAMQVQKMELERQNIRRVFYLVAQKNGWTKRLPGLDFIVQANVLTTTDTGGSAKAVVTGPVNPKSHAPDKNDSRDQRSAA